MHDMTSAGFTEVQTVSGQVGLSWGYSGYAPRVHRITLPGDPRQPAEGAGALPYVTDPPDRRLRALIDGIRWFLEGHDVQFDPGILDLDRCQPFQRSVLMAEYGIPRGYVSTYGRIARHIGRPGAARAVGNSLARNPFPIVIPCHRAVRSDGSLGGFQGGSAMKQRLLEAEGIRFGEDGKILMDRVWYD